MGLKSDLLKDNTFLRKLHQHGKYCVKKEEIQTYLKSTKQIISYVECSALTGHNVKLLFENVIQAVQTPKNISQSNIHCFGCVCFR